MTNKDKYLKDGVDVEKFITELELEIDRKQGNVITDYKLDVALHEFFESEVKPTLSEDEKVILKNIEFKDYMVIGRKESGDLYVNDKGNDSFNGTWFIMFKKHLFQFIKPRRRIWHRGVARK